MSAELLPAEGNVKKLKNLVLHKTKKYGKIKENNEEGENKKW